MTVKKYNQLPHKDSAIQEIKWIEQVTNLLDSKFRIPGTSFTFGIDPIIGLVPFLGEIISFSISGLLVLSMIRHGVSREVAFKMIFNLGIDVITGTIPVLGDIFDVFYKANRRNYKLLKEHQLEGKHQGKGWRLLIGAVIVILLMLSILIFALVKIGQLLFEWIN